MVTASENMQKYFNKIEEDVSIAFTKAQEAKKLGFDYEKEVEITLAKNMAERVIGIISVVAPQMKNSGAAERIIELKDGLVVKR